MSVVHITSELTQQTSVFVVCVCLCVRVCVCVCVVCVVCVCGVCGGVCGVCVCVCVQAVVLLSKGKFPCLFFFLVFPCFQSIFFCVHCAANFSHVHLFLSQINTRLGRNRERDR